MPGFFAFPSFSKYDEASPFGESHGGGVAFSGFRVAGLLGPGKRGGQLFNSIG